MFTSCRLNEKASITKEAKVVLNKILAMCGTGNNISPESLAVLYVDGNCSLCSAYILNLLHENHGKSEQKIIILKDSNTYNLQDNVPELFAKTKPNNICLIIDSENIKAAELFELNKVFHFSKADLKDDHFRP